MYEAKVYKSPVFGKRFRIVLTQYAEYETGIYETWRKTMDIGSVEGQTNEVQPEKNVSKCSPLSIWDPGLWEYIFFVKTKATSQSVATLQTAFTCMKTVFPHLSIRRGTRLLHFDTPI